MWSKGKTIHSAQYLTDLLSFCFTSIRKQFLRYSYFEFDLEKIKGHGHGWGQRSRSHSSSSIQPIDLLFVSHQSNQPFLRYVQKSVWPWKNTSEIFEENLPKTDFLKEFLQDQIRLWPWALKYSRPAFFVYQCHSRDLGSRSPKGHPVHFRRPILSLSQIS